LEIRSGDALPDVSSTLQAASHEIAKAVRDDILGSVFTIDGVTYFTLPTAHEIGEKDAIKTLESLSGFSSSPGIWSGNPLYIGLGDGSFWQSTVLETAGDTYDLIAAAASFWAAGIESLANADDLVSLWYGQGSVGRSDALAQIAASLAATNSFFEAAYGYFGEIGIGGFLGDQIVVGSQGHDFALEEQLGLSWNTFIHGGGGNDLLVGSLGKDTLDGGSDHDEASFYVASGEMTDGVIASIFNLDSSAEFSTEVAGADLQSFLFNIEELALGRHDDILEIINLDGSTTSLNHVYGGDNGGLGDKIDLSSFTMSGAFIDLEGETLRLTNSQTVVHVHDFENAVGTAYNDIVTGNNQANGNNGNTGADELFGFDGDDFIFFDAEDTVVNGGAGRDVAVALTGDPIMATGLRLAPFPQINVCNSIPALQHRCATTGCAYQCGRRSLGVPCFVPS
jgi:RTX calcium-binding nonapeptide repeat (4 copies)